MQQSSHNVQRIICKPWQFPKSPDIDINAVSLRGGEQHKHTKKLHPPFSKSQSFDPCGATQLTPTPRRTKKHAFY